jgi:mRNA interferase RelE/StbE
LAERRPYRVLVSRAAQRDFDRLPPDARERLIGAIVSLADDPPGQSEKLAAQDAHRRRVGDYRVVFQVDDKRNEVLIARIKHRRDVYRR